MAIRCAKVAKFGGIDANMVDLFFFDKTLLEAVVL